MALQSPLLLSMFMLRYSVCHKTEKQSTAVMWTRPKKTGSTADADKCAFTCSLPFCPELNSSSDVRLQSG